MKMIRPHYHSHNRRLAGNGNYHHMSKCNGYVYVFYLGFSDLHKIGMCKNIERRVKELSASNPKLTALITCVVKNPYDVERELHQKFKRHLVEREIYHLSPEDLGHIQRYLDERGHSELVLFESHNSRLVPDG